MSAEAILFIYFYGNANHPLMMSITCAKLWQINCSSRWMALTQGRIVDWFIIVLEIRETALGTRKKMSAVASRKICRWRLKNRDVSWGGWKYVILSYSRAKLFLEKIIKKKTPKKLRRRLMWTTWTERSLGEKRNSNFFYEYFLFYYLTVTLYIFLKNT